MWKFSQMFRRYRTASARGAWAGAPHGNVGTEPPLSSIFAARPSGRPAPASGRLPPAVEPRRPRPARRGDDIEFDFDENLPPRAQRNEQVDGPSDPTPEERVAL